MVRQPKGRVDWRAQRDKYGPVLIALVLVLIVPIETRQSLWRWALKGSDVLDVIVAVLILTNLRSMGEHRQSARKLDDIGDELKNGIEHRLGRIEKSLGCERDE